MSWWMMAAIRLGGESSHSVSSRVAISKTSVSGISSPVIFINIIIRSPKVREFFIFQQFSLV